MFGFVAGTTAATVATEVIGLTLSTALAVGMRMISGGAPVQRSPIGPPQVFRQSVTDSFLVYGKRRVGGLMVFFHPKQSGDTHYRYFVIAAAGHRCKGVVKWMLGDEEVTLDGTDGNGMVTSGKYAGACWLWFQRGLDSETANATFVAECDGKWTTAHKGNGIAAIYAKFAMTDDVVQAGMPNITAVIEGKDDILDPRDGLEKYTRNGPLVFYDWMNLPREEGGFGAYADEIPDDDFISAQANVADETVDGEARYSLDAFIVTGSTPSEIRDVMTVNMAGTYTYSGGKHLMRPGYFVAVSKTLSEDDLAGPIQVSPFMASDRAANEVSGTYVSPDDGYQAKAFATQSVAEDDIRQLDLDLAYTTSPKQAARIASIMLKRAQHELTVVWPMNCVGIGVMALDTVQLATRPSEQMRYGLDNYAFMVTSWGLSADYGCLISLREESEDIYDEPTVTVPAAPPAIDVAQPVTQVRDITRTISLSGTSGLTFSADSSGNVTISDHNRVYVDKTVAVTGTGGTPLATGAAPGKYVTVFYDQADRSGGAVTYQYLITDPGADNSAAYASSAHPYRHFVCIVLIPASGSTGGGSAPGDGGGTSGPGGPGTVIP